MIGQTIAQATSRQMELSIEPVGTVQPTGLAGGETLMLARAADTKGVARSEFLRDLAPLVSAVEVRLATLIADGLASDGGGRVVLTDAGRAHLLAALGLKALPKDGPKHWDEMRGCLLAHVLGVKPDALKRKVLAKPDGLRAAILDQAFDLKLKGAMTTARLRAALAVVALERAFGNKVKAGLGTGTGLSPKAGRLLAGQLSKAPRDFGTDSRLVAALAAEQAGASSSDFEALRVAVLTRFVGVAASAAAVKVARAKPMPTLVPVPVAQLSPGSQTPVPQLPKIIPISPEFPSRPAASHRPDLAGFADAIKAIAKLRAEGWSGSRKSYIADVWDGVKSRFTSWGLTEVEFKSMLAEAHRTGHIVLANADLKTKDNAARLAASAVSYKNTVWHFVRVED